MKAISNLILYIFLKLQVAYACWACHLIHVCKKSTDIRVPVFTKLAVAQHHYVQKPIYVRNTTFAAPNFTIFPSPRPSRPALGPPQPPVGWGLGLLPRGVRRPGRGAEHPPQSTVKSRMNTVIFLPTLCAFLARYEETFTSSVISMQVTPVEAQ